MSSRRVGALSSSFTCMEPLFFLLHMNSLERMVVCELRLRVPERVFRLCVVPRCGWHAARAKQDGAASTNPRVCDFQS